MPLTAADTTARVKNVPPGSAARPLALPGRPSEVPREVVAAEDGGWGQGNRFRNALAGAIMIAVEEDASRSMVVADLLENAPDVLVQLAELDAADLALGAVLVEVARSPATYAERRAELDDLNRLREAAARGVASALLAAYRKRSVQAAMALPVEEIAISLLPPPPSDVEERSSAEAPPISRVDEVAATAVSETATAGALAPPLTAEDIARQLRENEAPFSPRNDTSPQRDADLLRTLLHHAGRPADDPANDIERLTNATERDNWPRWDRLSADAQRRWMRYLVAWVRAAEDTKPGDPELRRSFSRLSEYSKTRRPGLVNGFNLRHMAERSSWLDDARAIAEEIRPVAIRSIATADAELVVVADASSDVDDDDNDDEDIAGPPDGWPFWSSVQGRRAVIFGGSPREERRFALERAFRLESLEWIESKKPRLVNSLCDRIRSRGIDLVLVTKFASHVHIAALVDSAKAVGAISVVLRYGYGVEKVREGIEVALAGPGRPRTG